MKKMVMILVASLGAQAAELTTVSSVDLARYAGKWYEIATIPQDFQKQCVKNVTAEYSVVPDGLLDVRNSCTRADGSASVAMGRGQVVDQATNAKLKVTFVYVLNWIYALGGDYWIIDLDSSYQWAVVGAPERNFAWVLSRNPSMEKDVLQGIESRLKDKGYDSCLLRMTVQDGGNTVSQRLCDVVR